MPTQQQAYQFSDDTLQAATQIKYVDTETVAWLDHVQVRAEDLTDPDRQADRGSRRALWRTAGRVKAPLQYADAWTLWVEPETGVVIKGPAIDRQSGSS